MNAYLNLILSILPYVLCKQENESVIHLFAICSEARSLWDQLSTWTSSQNIILLPNLVPQVMIVGVWDGKMQDLINPLIFICFASTIHESFKIMF